MASCAYKPGELFCRPVLARLNQKDEEESNSSLDSGIVHSGEIIPVKGKGLDVNDSPDGAVHEDQPLENNTSIIKSRGKEKSARATTERDEHGSPKLLRGFSTT